MNFKETTLVSSNCDNRMASKTVFTIGYGNRPIEDFLGLLRQYGIETVCDVRSSPYSSRFPNFTRDSLSQALSAKDVKYVFLGNELGARPSDPDLYEDGRASYTAMANSAAFRQGIERVEVGAEKYTLALLCAEKDPLDCHRAILISPALAAAGIVVNHIGPGGRLESQRELERRLLRKLGLDQVPLFGSPNDSNPIEQAYVRRGYELAYDIEADYRTRLGR